MTHFPVYPSRTVHSLDGLWDFTFIADLADPAGIDLASVVYDDRLPVPGVFDVFSRYLGKRGTGVYRTTVKVTPGTPGRLHVGGLGLWGEIYVDGKRAHTCQLPYSGFQVALPAAPQALRELVVVVDNRFNPARVPLFEKYFDFYAYGGIYRSVEWHELHAPVAIDRAQIQVLDLATGRIQVKATWTGKVPQSTPAFEIDGAPVQAESVAVHGESLIATLRVPDPTPWSVDTPTLHTLQLSLGGDAIIERFGLRTVTIMGREIQLNGTPTKLKGFCRHEAHPQFGPALPLAQLVADLALLKDLGCNFVRGSHYPQDQRFLDLCDEMGLMVFEESLGWGQRDDRFANDAFIDTQEQQTRLMVRNSYNHPSVILWGFLNEGGSDKQILRPLYQRLARALREEDSSRPISYATNTPFNDINYDLCDIVCVNIYPGWYSKDLESSRPLDEIVPTFNAVVAHVAAGHADKPILVSEIGAGAIYGWRDPYATRWSEQYQDEFLHIVCEHILNTEDFIGVALWQFCDCRTYASIETLVRPRGFNNKGILNEYRLPKQAYTTVKRHFAGT